MIEHPEFDKSLKNSIGIWTVDDKIVGAAIYDMYFGEGFCGVLPDYKDLYKAVLEYVCKELKDDFAFGLAICDENADEIEMTKSLGFTPSHQDETIMERSLSDSFEAKLPDGLKFFCPDPLENAYELQWLFWQGLIMFMLSLSVLYRHTEEKELRRLLSMKHWEEPKNLEQIEPT